MVATRKKRLSAEDRRRRILEGALEVFAKRGYSDASMTAVARAAGITPAVIYDHFSSKAELHRTLIQQQAEKLLTSVGAAVADAPDEPAERMRIGVDAFFRFVEGQEFAWWLLLRDPPADPALARTYDEIQLTATQGIAAFIRQGAPPELLERPDADRDLEMFAQLLRTAQNGLAAWWYAHPEVPREEVVDRVLEFCWLGLERVAGGERARGR